MTDLEVRVASLEQNVLALARAVSDISTTHTLFASAAVIHLKTISDQLKTMREEMGGSDDSWEDFG